MIKSKKVGLISGAIFASICLLSFFIFAFFNLTISEKPRLTFSKNEAACYQDKSNQNQIPIDINQHLDVLVWNLYKQNKPLLLPELSTLVEKHDLSLLQEALSRPDLLALLRDKKQFFDQVNAFTFNGETAGVMTTSQYKPMRVCAFIEKEPLIQLPKSGLLSQYPLSNGEILSVINLHSVNFTFDLAVYQNQIQALINEVNQTKGPLIMGGDFNSWSEARFNLLNELLSKLGLKPVLFEKDQRLRVFGYPLDHLYYRDLRLIKASSKETKASDHAWLSASFSFL